MLCTRPRLNLAPRNEALSNNTNCPGGSHYDLWFKKTRQADNKYLLEASFFFNDNCRCEPQNEINPVAKSIITSSVSNIRIMKYDNKHTVYCDDQILLSFTLNTSIVNKVMFGVGTHYISNFRAQVF